MAYSHLGIGQLMEEIFSIKNDNEAIETAERRRVSISERSLQTVKISRGMRATSLPVGASLFYNTLTIYIEVI
jgi:hypothetical protein